MIDTALLDYLRAHSATETPCQRDNRQQTEAAGMGHIQLTPEQGQLMTLLLRLIGARRGLEIGVYAGYSALWLAGALPADGYLLACDIDDEITLRARQAWSRAGLAERIELRIGRALDILDDELNAGRAATYDFAVIDADKGGYLAYYERCLQLVRAGGLILADNTLWYGRVADPDNQDDDTVAIRAFNQRLAQDERIDLSLIPIGDGLSVARKR